MRIETGLTMQNPVPSDKLRMAKIADGAHAFEAMMLEQMLKPLQFGGAPGSGSDDEGSGADTTRGMGTEALAKSIASQGGFGIARQIVRQVTAEDAAVRAAHSGGDGSKVQ